jgi:hypothetical protein
MAAAEAMQLDGGGVDVVLDPNACAHSMEPRREWFSQPCMMGIGAWRLSNAGGARAAPGGPWLRGAIGRGVVVHAVHAFGFSARTRQPPPCCWLCRMQTRRGAVQ